MISYLQTVKYPIHKISEGAVPSPLLRYIRRRKNTCDICPIRYSANTNGLQQIQITDIITNIGDLR